jgi:hypothetical protein
MKIKFTLLFSFFVQIIFAQNFSQTIRGRVLDLDTKSPLPGVTIRVLNNADALMGSSTDLNGYYEIKNVPTGRLSLSASFIGYKTQTIGNLELNSGKELIVNFSLEESITSLNEVVVTAETNDGRASNDMASVSARQFSVEESQRYAGSRNDVARMASNFAGVATANDGVNDIVIRGNSPIGVLWRLEGIDIFNPNHFGGAGATGGPVSMINNNNLANSDFFTGAFPSMYGNALSGAFDLSLRSGNYAKHEFLGQIGFNGFELGAEGPINKDKNSSYLVNYRYSALGLMSNLGFDFGTGAGIPYYQDLTFKVNLPQTKYGSIAVFGLAGLNSINFINSEVNPEDIGSDFYSDANRDIRVNQRMGVVGVSHTLSYGSNTYGKLVLAAQTTRNTLSVDTFDLKIREPFLMFASQTDRSKLSAHYFINQKFNAKNKLRIGIIADQHFFNFSDSVYVKTTENFRNLTTSEGNTLLVQPYAQWQHNVNEDLQFNVGLRGQLLTLNSNSISVEPRLGMRYQLPKSSALTAGYGLHSQMAPLEIYFRQTRLTENEYIETNKNLGFMQSHHLVLGYERQVLKGLNFKSEVYYQHLFNVPVQQQASAYSVLNNGTFNEIINDSLINEGTGRNMGVEFTLQKVMKNGNYFMSTLSLYDSRYKGSDGVERSTAFNGNFIFNFVGGKEVTLNANKETKNKRMLNFDAKLTYAGGQRYTPLNLEASRQNQAAVFDLENPFSKQYNNFFRLDLGVALRTVKKKYTEEYRIEIQNVTNHQNPFAETYNPITNSASTIYQFGFFPMLQYRITF